MKTAFALALLSSLLLVGCVHAADKAAGSYTVTNNAAGQLFVLGTIGTGSNAVVRIYQLNDLLTNKTFVAPTISDATISAPTISGPTFSGTLSMGASVMDNSTGTILGGVINGATLVNIPFAGITNATVATLRVTNTTGSSVTLTNFAGGGAPSITVKRGATPDIDMVKGAGLVANLIFGPGSNDVDWASAEVYRLETFGNAIELWPQSVTNSARTSLTILVSNSAGGSVILPGVAFPGGANSNAPESGVTAYTLLRATKSGKVIGYAVTNFPPSHFAE